MRHYNLITTSNKNFWMKSKKNLLIGDWCLLNNNNLKDYKYTILKYHWHDLEKKKRDVKYIGRVHRVISQQLAISLNKYHNVNLPLKYWETLFFPWLHFWIEVVFDRWETIKIIKKKNSSLSVNLTKSNDKNFIVNDGRSLTVLTKGPEWNNWIFFKVINYLGNIKVNVLKKNTFKKKNKKKTQKNYFFYIISWINKLFFIINNKVIMSNIYLPKFTKLFLNLSLKQIKVNMIGEKIREFKISRKKFFINKKLKTKNKFIDFLLYLIPLQIPKVFLEGYSEINSLIKKSDLEKKPKIIFTALDQYYNEYFKFYVAKKRVEHGTKYVILQHGMADINLFNSLKNEIKISDRYLSTGNYIKNKKIYPLFLPSVINKKPIKKSFFAKGLLISVFDIPVVPHRLTPYPVGLAAIDKYVLTIVDLLKMLPADVVSNSKIKFRQTVTDSYFYKKLKHNLHLHKINIEIYDNKKKLVHEESKNYKLVIETFNSTGLLESLNLNIPVILLINKSMFNLKKIFKKDFDVLKKNNIINFSSKECSEFINKNYKNLDFWWNSKNVQQARLSICNKFARSSSSPINDVKKSLNFKT